MKPILLPLKYINTTILSFVFYLLFVHAAIGQEDLSKYTFIKPEFNRLYFSADSSALIALNTKLDLLKENRLKRINIVHFGGSHVQGGTWSNTFASDFQKKFNSQGGGYFIFPYKIAKTNGQPYANSFSTGKWKRCRAIGKDFCQPLGMCAMNITCNDSSATFGVCYTGRAMCGKANLVKIYHSFNSSFEIRLKNQDSLGVVRTDVEANNYSSFRFANPIDSVIFEMVKKDTVKRDFTLYGLSMENDEVPGFFLAGLGANGASSSSFLRCEYLVPQLQALSPDIVILSLGVNDTQSKGFEKDDYIENYDSLILSIKRASPNTFIVLTTTTDNFIRRKTSNKRTVTAREAMFELMEKHHVAVWDLFSLMGGYKSMTKWYKAGLAARDKVHFNGKGYTLLGNMMFDAFIKSYHTNYK